MTIQHVGGGVADVYIPLGRIVAFNHFTDGIIKKAPIVTILVYTDLPDPALPGTFTL